MVEASVEWALRHVPFRASVRAEWGMAEVGVESALRDVPFGAPPGDLGVERHIAGAGLRSGWPPRQQVFDWAAWARGRRCVGWVERWQADATMADHSGGMRPVGGN